MQNKKEMKQSFTHSSFFSKNTRGQGLSVNAIILIVLGLAVLAFLILGFFLGWQKVLPFIGGDTVDNIVDKCSTACLAGQQYNFCGRTYDLKVEGNSMGVDSCYNFSTLDTYSSYGIAVCTNPAIVCSQPEEIPQ